MTEMRWLDGITDLMDNEFEQAQRVGDRRKAWHTAVHGVAKSRTRLSDFTFFHFLGGGRGNAKVKKDKASSC